MYRQKFKYEFGPMIFLWRLKFQRDFVLKFFVKNAFVLKSPSNKFFFLGYLRPTQCILTKKPIFKTKFIYQNYFQNVKLECDFKSKSQGLFKYGVGYESMIFLIVHTPKSKTANLKNFLWTQASVEKC